MLINKQCTIHFELVTMQQGSLNNTIGIQILTDHNYISLVNENNEQRFIEEKGARGFITKTIPNFQDQRPSKSRPKASQL